MKHATATALDQLEPLLERLRALDCLTRAQPGRLLSQIPRLPAFP
jgi:hypothetical protein